jgi:hypothetical protein
MAIQPAVLNVSEVGSTIFGMISGMFAALSTTVITTAVKATVLIDKCMNVGINSVSALENITDAVEQRSKIYGAGMVSNGELAERETKLKYILRLKNLENQEAKAPATKADVHIDNANAAEAQAAVVKITSAVPAA